MKQKSSTNLVNRHLTKSLLSNSNVNPFSFAGTVFYILSQDIKMYGLFMWMGVWLALRHAGIIEPLEISDIIERYLSYFQYALTFLLTFFLNSTYSDFREQGRAAFCASSPANNLVFMIKVHLKHEPAIQKRLIRLLNATHYVSWMDLAGWYSWKELERRGLLSPDEINFLSCNTSKKHPQVMLWVLEELAAYYRHAQEHALQEEDSNSCLYKKGMAKMENGIFLSMQDELLKARMQFTQLSIYRSVPVPLIYTHMLAWLLMTFLVVLGFYAGVGEDRTDKSLHNKIWWIGGYIIVVLAFLSLYDVAMALREPFGVDITDIDPLNNVESTIEINKIFFEGPSMLEQGQQTKMHYSLFSKDMNDTFDTASSQDCFHRPARALNHLPTSSELRQTLISQLNQSSKTV